MINLDFEAARHGLNLVSAVTNPDDEKNVENLINQALGILCEQSPFAMMLWGGTKYNNNPPPENTSIGNALWKEGVGLLKSADILNTEFPEQSLDLTRLNADLCADFQKLNLARELLERMLVYARYYAKSAKSKG